MVAPSVPQYEDRLVASNAADASLIQLIATLEDLVKAYQQFLGLLQREKVLMIDGDVNPLIQCLSEKEGLLGRLSQLEIKRQDELVVLGKIYNLPEQSFSLPDLVALVAEPYQSQLHSCHLRLLALSASIKEINEVNSLIVERTLQRVVTLIGLIKHLALPVSTYQASGCLTDFPVFGKTIGRG